MNPRIIDHWVAGANYQPASQRRFESSNPDNGQILAQVARGCSRDVDAAVTSAADCFLSYQATAPSFRERILLRAADRLEQDAKEFQEILIEEIGSPVSKAEMEINLSARVLRANASIARRLSGRTYPSDLHGRWSLGFRRPLGVVAGITPFNVPLIKGIKHSSMPLACGNTVVWLPSEHTPIIANRVAELFSASGLPDGGLNVVHGFGSEIGDVLVGDRRVRAVGFTGSQRVGRHVQQRCGEYGKRVTLELGGKNPLIVLDDADLQQAIAAAIRGAFVYQGQICMATSRILLEDRIAEEFIAAFVDTAKSLSLGDLHETSTMIGPIISRQSRTRIQELLDEAIAGGAQVLCGNCWSGNRLNPTVLNGVRPEMRIAREEVFGPVVIIETVRDRHHALQQANAVDGMLSAAIFTSNLDAAISLAESIDSGMVHINDMTIQQEPQVPFGGDGASGFGREGFETALDDFTTWKWVTVKKVEG